MATWSFNAAGSENRAVLLPRNHDPPGNPSMAELAKTGNTLRVEVHAPRVVKSMLSPPGAGWTGVRTSGQPTRIIVWHWRIAAIDRANLLTVRYKIERYFDRTNPADANNPRAPGAYTLTDGVRSSLAVLLPDGTRAVGPMLKTPDGRFLENWVLTFFVGRALLTATAF